MGSLLTEYEINRPQNLKLFQFIASVEPQELICPHDNESNGFFLVFFFVNWTCNTFSFFRSHPLFMDFPSELFLPISSYREWFYINFVRTTTFSEKELFTDSLSNKFQPLSPKQQSFLHKYLFDLDLSEIILVLHCRLSSLFCLFRLPCLVFLLCGNISRWHVFPTQRMCACNFYQIMTIILRTILSCVLYKWIVSRMKFLLSFSIVSAFELFLEPRRSVLRKILLSFDLISIESKRQALKGGCWTPLL